MNMKSRWSLKLIMLLIIFGLTVFVGCQGVQKTGQEKEKEKEKEEKTEVVVDFPQKDLEIIVPLSPGGGFDLNARMFAPHFSEHLPQKVNVIVKNIPGGDNIIGINTMLNAEPDGHTICIFNIPGNVMAQITGAADYDLAKLNWIGRVSNDIYVGCMSPHSKYRTVEDLIQAEKVNIGMVGLTSTAGLGAAITAEMLGINATMVPHGGSSEVILSAIRGDIDWLQYPLESVLNYVESGEIIPVVVFADERIPELPDTPTIVELGYPEELVSLVQIHRIFATSPDVPEEIVKILRDAYQMTVEDPAFQEDMNKAGFKVSPLNHEEIVKVVKDALEGYSQYKDLILQHQQ